MTERRLRYAAVARGFLTAVMRVSEAGLAVTSDSSLPGFSQLLGNVGDFAVSVVEEDYVATTTLALSSLRQAGLPLDARLTRWVNFAGALTAAKTPTDVEGVLEQFALPPASYSVKRYPPPESERGAAVFVNAYFGASAGGEWLSDRGREHVAEAWYAGATLPIGIEFTLGRSPQSLFVSVIDLGAVASYRLGGGSVDPSPNVTFANVIAPGIFITRSVAKSFPLAVGFGWQYAPRLRTVSGPLTQAPEARDASRFGVFVASDIPFFRIR